MKKLIILILVLSARVTFGQQDPIYAQYFNNPLTINPAYAGSNNMFNASLQYRTQWAGLDANPTTINFSSHMSVYHNRAGAGIMVIQDKLGDTKNTEYNGIFAYKIPLKDATFSFGLQMGFIRYTNDPSMLSIRDPGDPAFLQLSETKFNTGVGLMLKSDRYMIGLSVPRLLPATVSQGGQTIQLYSQNFYLFGAYAAMLNENIRFKPSLLLRGTQGTSWAADVNASFTFKDLYTAGIFTRTFKTYGFVMQAQFGSMRLGYVFELPGSPASSLNFSSHEISLGVSLGLLPAHDRAQKTF